jgi:hypothetical protein
MQIDLKPGEPVRVYWNSTYIDIKVEPSDEVRNTSYLVIESPGKRMRISDQDGTEVFSEKVEISYIKDY